MVDIPSNALTIYKSDFDGRVDIIPVSDPNIPSSAHRMMMAQLALQLSQSAPPGMFNVEELNRTILTAANLPNLDKIMPRKPDPEPLDPVSDIQAAVKGMPIQAFSGQDNQAHIQIKTSFIQDPMNGGNPLMQRIVPILQANIQEHIMMKYKEQILGVSEQLIQQHGPQAVASGMVDPNDPRILDQVQMMAAQQVQQANAAMAAQQMAQTPEAQMLGLEQQRVQLEEQKLQIEIAKQTADSTLRNRSITLDEQELQLDMFKAGVDISSKQEEKQKDRDAKMAIVALEGLLDLAKNTENVDRDKALKAADVISKLIDTDIMSKR